MRVLGRHAPFFIPPVEECSPINETRLTHQRDHLGPKTKGPSPGCSVSWWMAPGAPRLVRRDRASTGGRCANPTCRHRRALGGPMCLSLRKGTLVDFWPDALD